MSKYDVPSKMAKRIRAELKLHSSVAVRYSRAGMDFQVLAEDSICSIQRDCKSCVLARRLEILSGHTALVFNRFAVVVQRDKGKKVAKVFALGFNAATRVFEFDTQGKPMGDNIVHLLRWPSSWFPEARKAMASTKGVKAGETRIRPVRQSTRVSRPTLVQLSEHKVA